MKIFGEIGVLADDGERVQCHCCGKWFKCLGRHINKMHNLTGEGYKEVFGLNRTQPLASELCRAVTREATRDHLDRMHILHGDKWNAFVKMSRPPSKRGKTHRKQADCAALMPEYRDKILVNLKKGNAASKTPEAIAKMIKSKTGYKATPETRAKIAESQRNRRATQGISLGTRAKLSAAGKGRVMSERTKEKLRRARIGKKLSAEHKAKISEGLSRYKESKTRAV